MIRIGRDACSFFISPVLEQRAGTTKRKRVYVFPALKGANEKLANWGSPSDNAALKIRHCIFESMYSGWP